MCRNILAGYPDHLEALADEAIEPEDLDVLVNAGKEKPELICKNSAARHNPCDLPDPDTLGEVITS